MKSNTKLKLLTSITCGILLFSGSPIAAADDELAINNNPTL